MLMRTVNRFRASLTREDGAAFVWFLITVPALVISLALAVEITELTQTAAWFQEALNRSAKAAAFQIRPESYAVGQPELDPVAAEDAFRAILAHNLNLDPLTLAPLSANGRLTEPPVYTLIVHNGPWPDPVADLEYDLTTEINEPAVIALCRIRFNAIISGRTITIRRVAIARVVEDVYNP